jgi:flagellar biosynthesis protein FliR
MPADFPVNLAILQSFVYVLARIAGAVVFVPIPGMSATPAPVRIFLAAAFTLALFPAWPAPPANHSLGAFIANMLAEAVFGIAVGLVVAFVLEAFVMAAQLLSVQAGFSYASTTDPTTQADSTVLLVITQLTAGMLFFAVGLDRQVLGVFANSLSSHPPGSLVFTPEMGYDLIRLGSGIFTTALRLVMPIIALLIMLDLAMGLLGRLNAQLQLVTLAFPVKILAVLPLFAWSILLFPRASSTYIETAFGLIRKLAGQ